jgi:hypothetical protein
MAFDVKSKRSVVYHSSREEVIGIKLDRRKAFVAPNGANQVPREI